jgi:large subunit ribosomal protein L24
MKLKLKDKVMVISGKDKGKKGEIVAILPRQNQVIVENINVYKKHLKPSQKHPKGGIVDVTKPIDTSKVMAIDPASGRVARVSYKMNAKNQRERVFKVSKFKNKPIAKRKKDD